MRRATFKRSNTTITEPCPKCGATVELDNPIVNGDDNDMTQLQGTCECGHEIVHHADDYEPDYEPELEHDRKGYPL